ncbi:MAG: hypothetical protein ACLFS3_00690 [Candidatus Aenigmatarchaeota archaeon]
MLKWLKSNFEDRSGQFFIISIVIVITILASVSSLMNNYYNTGISQAASLDEGEFFWNVKSQVNGTIVESGNVNRVNNFRDFVVMAEERTSNRGFQLTIKNETPFSGDSVNVSISLYSAGISIEDEDRYEYS